MSCDIMAMILLTEDSAYCLIIQGNTAIAGIVRGTFVKGVRFNLDALLSQMECVVSGGTTLEERRVRE